MSTHRTGMTPYIPSDHGMQNTNLLDLSHELTARANAIAGQIAPASKEKIIEHMAVINSYYSNLIEGNSTEPYDIRAAQQGNFSNDPATRDLQLESIAHIKVQHWIKEQNPDLNRLFSIEFIQQIHQEFYNHVPDSLKLIKDRDGTLVRKVLPGEFRDDLVQVSQHIPPEPQYIESLLGELVDEYHPDRFQGDKKAIAVMCAHHRFAWIHPFWDGNGRTGRLFTDTALRKIGLESEGIWCLSRGLARHSAQYKTALAKSDMVRQGDGDGRGTLSEKSLIEFTLFMQTTAIDQIKYMEKLLNIKEILKRIQGYVDARNDGRIAGYPSLRNEAIMLLYTAFTHGELTREHARSCTGLSDKTAQRLIKQLKEEGLLSETSSRSPLYWEIPEHAEPWYFPALAPSPY